MTGPGLQSVRVVGGIVPPGLLARVQAGEVRDAASLSSASYHLPGRETVRDAANRAWTYLCGAWTAWQEYAASQPPGAPGTGPARERWLLVLLRELGYGQVPALPSGLVVDGQEYPVSHAWQHVPIHLLGPGVDLDHRNRGVAGAARAPQAMVQELLNRDDTALWALLSNGMRLRLLRDSTALAGSAYLEFDLEAIFDGELFSEFLLLWQVCHVSRLEKREGADAPAADCWEEAWRSEAVDAGTRALDRLRQGVEAALEALGTGFIASPMNRWLVQALESGEVTATAYHRALLRLAYRLLFLSVAEDRDALLVPDATHEMRDQYTRYFSMGRLRRLSRLRAGGPHGDLWEGLKVVLDALGGDGETLLGLPVLGGLFDPADRRLPQMAGRPEGVVVGRHVDYLLHCGLANNNLLSAARSLGWVALKGQRVQPVDYRNLGAEELGSVYESLLELVPRLDLGQRTFTLEKAAGNERKTTGSYYTPPALVGALLDSALDPLLDDAVKNAVDAVDAEARLLTLTVCDPACGSGHFLVAAARRIARRLAQIRSGEDEPTPAEVRHALRGVVGRCIYGVDINELAAELAKVSLWLEALEPGKPLGFLDARIRVGNSLLGTTPALLAAGVPDDAFKEIEGDDKRFAALVRRRNKKERVSGQLLLTEAGLNLSNAVLVRERTPLLAALDRADAVRAQVDAWTAYEESDELSRWRLHADMWCAAFVWRLVPDGIDAPTESVVRLVSTDPEKVDLAVREEARRIAQQYQFFHWHLEFPEIFAVADQDNTETGPAGWTGGFSCLLGNPPWERVKLQEQEFFAALDPEIAAAPNAAVRRKLIKSLAENDQALFSAFGEAKRRAEGESALLRNSGRYPLTGRGDVNTYAVFAETFRMTTGPYGRAGFIVPTGIATDATTQYFFRDLVESASLSALYDFENAAPIFKGVHRSFKFCLLSLAGRLTRESAASFAFFVHDASMIAAATFSLTQAEIALLNPNTGTCPIFRSRRDAEITLGIYRRVPVLIRQGVTGGNPWGVSFMTMFHMSNDSSLFLTGVELESDGWVLRANIFERNGNRMLPLYEAKMLHHYDHRWATYNDGATRELSLDEKQNSHLTVLPRYWVAEAAVEERLARRWDKDWLVGWRNICRTTDERTTIAFALPYAAVGHSTPLIIGRGDPVLPAALASFVCDYVARQKVGGTNFTFNYFEQLAVPPPNELSFPAVAEISLQSRILELFYTSWDMQSFARDLGDGEPPFRWDEERRAVLRAELDAAFFHLYGVERDDVDYILDTFPIVRRKDEQRFGEYRTKRLILEIYNELAAAAATGSMYVSRLNPPPGQGPRHPAKRDEY